MTGRMCEVKFKNMKATLRTIKLRLGKTGAAGGTKLPYFEVMSNLLGHDVAINPNNIAEAGAAGFNRIRVIIL